MHLSQIEREAIEAPPFKTIRALLEALNVNPEKMIKETLNQMDEESFLERCGWVTPCKTARDLPTETERKPNPILRMHDDIFVRNETSSERGCYTGSFNTHLKPD